MISTITSPTIFRRIQLADLSTMLVLGIILALPRFPIVSLKSTGNISTSRLFFRSEPRFFRDAHADRYGLRALYYLLVWNVHKRNTLHNCSNENSEGDEVVSISSGLNLTQFFWIFLKYEFSLQNLRFCSRNICCGRFFGRTVERLDFCQVCIIYFLLSKPALQSRNARNLRPDRAVQLFWVISPFHSFIRRSSCWPRILCVQYHFLLLLSVS